LRALLDYLINPFGLLHEERRRLGGVHRSCLLLEKVESRLGDMQRRGHRLRAAREHIRGTQRNDNVQILEPCWPIFDSRQPIEDTG
jgi:hypothetical protein